MRTVTFTTETWLKLQRAAEAIGTTPDTLAERLLGIVLDSCAPGVTRSTRETVLYRLNDWRMDIIDGQEEETNA